MEDLGFSLFLAVGAVALFTFLAVAAYSDNRTKERATFQRNETLRKVAERSGEGAEKVLEVMREEERIANRRKLEGLKLGGLITCAVGLGLMVFLGFIEPLATGAGLIPLLVGAVILAYVFFFASEV